MPTATSPPPSKRARPVRRRMTSAVPTQLAMPEEPKVRTVNGIKVVEEQLLYLNPKGGPLKISKLELADGTLVHNCRDCNEFTGSRGDVMVHRNREHGARYGLNRPKGQVDVLGDILIPQREDGHVPDRADEMTLGEVLAVMPSIKELGDFLDRSETGRIAAELRLRDIEKSARTTAAMQDEIDQLQGKIVKLRQRDRLRGNYDEIKQEMYRLKAWKRMVVKRFAAAGFKLDEEEQ